MSLLNPPAYSKDVVNNKNNIKSGIKHEPPEPPAFSKDVLNDCNIIESGITYEPPEPTCIQQHLQHLCYRQGIEEANVLCHFQ
jgi:hypothetical protein